MNMIFFVTPYLAQAPDITNDATIGQIIVQPTPTATPIQTATPTPNASSTSTPYVSTSPSLIATPTTKPIIKQPIYQTPMPIKRYKQNALTIYGYGPSNSEVSLKGFGISEKTISDSSGLFMFSEIYSFTYTYPELCIQAVDDRKRTTQPSCIPALQGDRLIPLEVGPILLSPTISISENKIKEGNDALLTGKTTPNTKVSVHISKNEASENKLSIVRIANAYNLPVIDTKSNEEGEYSITLPTGESAEYKIFTSAVFGEDLSAKSNSLTFSVLTKVKTLIQKTIDFVLQNKMVVFAFVEVLVFVILFILALKSTTKRKKRHSESDYLKEVISST